MPKFEEEGSELFYAQQDLDKARATINDCNNRRREAMKSIRSQMGLSAESFGKRVGFTAPYIFMIESGKYQWSDAAIQRLNDSLSDQA